MADREPTIEDFEKTMRAAYPDPVLDLRDLIERVEAFGNLKGNPNDWALVANDLNDAIARLLGWHIGRPHSRNPAGEREPRPDFLGSLDASAILGLAITHCPEFWPALLTLTHHQAHQYLADQLSLHQPI